MAPLTLTPFAADHYSIIGSWFANERDVVQWGGPNVSYPLDPAQLDKMLPDRTASPSQLAWMALRGDDFVGHAQLLRIDAASGFARLGRVVIAPSQRGQRLAEGLVRAVLLQAFSIQKIDRVTLGVYSWNLGAIKTYQRLGFRDEGIKPGTVTVGGERWNVCEMSLDRGAALAGAGASVTGGAS